MPEGPSIVILSELLAPFEGRKVLAVEGNAKADIQRAKEKTLEYCLSWGKHTLLCFDDFYLRIHFLMFGTYRINERKETAPRLSLQFSDGEINFYTCSVQLYEGTPLAVYDWSSDLMSQQWNAQAALEKLQQLPASALICDALLNQEIFSGSGNIMKNEVLWRMRVHPESKVRAIPEKLQQQIVDDVHAYSFLFYEWKKQYVLKKNWKIYKKGICPRCNLKTTRAYLGRTPRLTTYCSDCQNLYSNGKSKSQVRKRKKAV